MGSRVRVRVGLEIRVRRVRPPFTSVYAMSFNEGRLKVLIGMPCHEEKEID